MRSALGLRDDQLTGALEVLTSTSTQALLSKQPNDALVINEAFTSLIVRIQINKVAKSQKQEEIKETDSKVKEDRRFQLDSLLMKVMKDRKILPHQELMAEILNRVNFPLETSAVKERIEVLIERDYIKRNASNAAVYEYVA